MTKLLDADKVLEVVERRLNADIAIHRRFAADERLSQEARDRREHWAECLEDTRDETVAAIRSLPAQGADSPGEVERLTFQRAMDVAHQGYVRWAAKERNALWLKRISGTPIPNDLLVSIAEQIVSECAALTKQEPDA